MQSEREVERGHMEAVDATLVAELDDIVDQSMRVDPPEVTYIPCVLTASSETRVLAHMAMVNPLMADQRVTRAGLRAAIAGGVLVEYISKSHIHRYGAHLNGTEAVAIYGPVAFEVRDERGALVAVIDYCAHPAFGDKPVHSEVTGRVR